MHNRLEKSADRRLREEQDAAYQRSLAADEAKEQARLQAALLQSPPAGKPESSRDTQQRTARRRAASKREALGPEPADGIALSFQLPSGRRLQRRFSASDPSRKLYAFVRASFADDEEDDFVIKSLFPATALPDGDALLDSLGLSTPQKLFVELVATKKEDV